MEFQWQYDEFAGKRGTPPGKEECLMWSAGWARGVKKVMEECRMKLRGANHGEGVPIQQSSTSMVCMAGRGER